MYCFLVYNEMNQLYVYTYPSLLGLPNPLGHHREWSWIPYAIQQVPTIYFTRGGVYMSIPISQFIPSPPPHLRPHPMSRCVSSVSVSPLLRCNRFICTIFLDSTYIFKIFHGPLMGSWALTCSLLCPVEKLAWPKGKCVEEVWGWTLQGAVWDHTVGWGGEPLQPQKTPPARESLEAMGLHRKRGENGVQGSSAVSLVAQMVKSPSATQET